MATGKGPGNGVGGARAHEEAGRVCCALALECDAGGTPVDRRGPSVGRAPGQAGAGVDVREAGCLRQGDGQ